MLGIGKELIMVATATLGSGSHIADNWKTFFDFIIFCITMNNIM